jgi:tetratricopeptide (TPR) repeat protein
MEALATPQSLTAEGWARMVLAMVQLAEGRLNEAAANLERSSVVHERLGDLRRHNQGRMIQAVVLWLQGDVPAALTQVTATTESSRRSADQHMQSGSNAHLGYLLLQVGRRAEARERLEEAARCADLVKAFPEQVYARGLLALSRVGDDRVVQAREEVERALAIQRHLLPTAIYAMEGYAALAEAAIEIDRLQPEGPHLAGAAMRGLEKYSQTFAIAEPRTLLLKGRWASNRGKRSEALRWLDQSLQAAERLKLPGLIAHVRAEREALARPA